MVQDNSMLSVCVSSCFCFSSPSLLLWRPCMPLLKMNLSTSIALTLAWPAFICNFVSCYENHGVSLFIHKIVVPHLDPFTCAVPQTLPDNISCDKSACKSPGSLVLSQLCPSSFWYVLDNFLSQHFISVCFFPCFSYMFCMGVILTISTSLITRKHSGVFTVYRKSQDMNHHAICLHVLSDSIRR